MKYKIGDMVRITDDEKLLNVIALSKEKLNGEYVGKITLLEEFGGLPYGIENDSWEKNWWVSDNEIIGLFNEEVEDNTSPSLDYKGEYYHVLEQLHKAELLNNVLLDYISLKDI